MAIDADGERHLAIVYRYRKYLVNDKRTICRAITASFTFGSTLRSRDSDSPLDPLDDYASLRSLEPDALIIS